jgi:large subunit ribosomal protein L30
MNKKNNFVDSLRVLQIGSSISCNKVQKATLRGLGLRKIGSYKILNNNPAIWGMINRVSHLVKVETCN